MRFLTVFILLIFVNSIGSSNAQYQEEHYPNNDFLSIVKDIYRKLGLEGLFKRIQQYVKKSVREGQRYTDRQFEYDVQLVKNDPSTIISFIRKITWPLIVQSSIKTGELITYSQNYLLRFLKTKCDKYIGKEALFHPWNILQEKDSQNVSFIVFIYGVAISLILVRLLSWWNFMVFVAVSFMLYSFGGPYLVFKWLLSITAAVWLLFDIALTYPLQLAIIILGIFILSYVKGVFTFVLPDRRDHYDAPPPYKFERRFQNIDREYQTLTSRLEDMEEKTSLLNRKLEQLSRSMERLAQIDDD